MAELNLTREEVCRLSEALKDERFRQLLREYSAEISDPENKKQYEAEITEMEARRGMDVNFLHPEARHVLKTRSAEKKCFINVCSDPLIDKPSCETGRDQHGKPGQTWTLPYSLTPGRPDRDARGDACVIYDALFHPHAFHIAAQNSKFMNVINSTAIRGIQESFHIQLDVRRTKVLKSKYKGVPQPVVIRKPTSGSTPHHLSKCEEEKVLFPYPDMSCTTEATSGSSKQAVTPHYTLKYRSVVDLQNYRYSRDSTSRMRPREIIIIIDLPMLTSACDVDVNVMERRLILETQKDLYKLELPLSYPVDEDKGEAKFNRSTKQLTLTLPVKNTESLDMTCDGGDHEQIKADLEEEKLHETQHMEYNSDVINDSTSEELAQKNIAIESVSNSCEPHTDDTSMNPTESRTKTGEMDHISLKYIPEIIPADDGNRSDMNINPHEKPVSIYVKTDEELVEKQSQGTCISSAGFTHESMMSHDDDRQYQSSMANKRPNMFLTKEEQPLGSYKPETREESQSALNHKHDTTSISSEKNKVKTKETADIDNYLKSHCAFLKEAKSDAREMIIQDHQTSAALCFQNSLCFDLD